MTTEEAIEILSDVGDINRCCAEDAEALDMAIKALEQQPCEDCISRKEVNVLVDELARAISDERCFISRGRSTAAILQDILDLLSVTPQQKIGHWINLENTKYKGKVLPFWDRYECSKCGGHGEGTFNYCPNCGAKMTESEEGE